MSSDHFDYDLPIEHILGSPSTHHRVFDEVHFQRLTLIVGVLMPSPSVAGCIRQSIRL
jgi:hypothetical protein